MSTFRLLGAAIVLGCAAAACSQPASVNPVQAKEEAAVAPLKARYKNVVTGTDVKDRTLILYVDVNNMLSMDEQAEIDMKAAALQRWKGVWSKAHAGKHGVVRLSVRDYYGKEIYTKSAAV